MHQFNQHNPYHAPEADFENHDEYEYDTTPFYKPSGRIGRLRYLAYSTTFGLCYLPIVILMGILFTMLLEGTSADLAMTLMTLLYVILMVGNLYSMFALARRRLHDLNKSGWWSLLFFVPFANIALVLYLLFARGDDYINDYGAPAMPASTRVKILAFIVPIFSLLFGVLSAIAIPAYQEYLIRAQMAQMG